MNSYRRACLLLSLLLILSSLQAPAALTAISTRDAMPVTAQAAIPARHATASAALGARSPVESNFAESVSAETEVVTVRITEAGFEPPLVSVSPGDSVTWRNETDSTVVLRFADTIEALPVDSELYLPLLESGAGAAAEAAASNVFVPQVFAAATGEASVSNQEPQRSLDLGEETIAPLEQVTKAFPNPTTQPFFDESRPEEIGAVVVAGNQCFTPVDRPAPPAAPKALKMPEKSACVDLPVTAPEPVEKMPTKAGDAYISYRYPPFGSEELSFTPGRLLRGHFGGHTIAPGRDPQGGLITKTVGWANMTPLAFVEASTGANLQPSSEPLLRLWGTCAAAPAFPYDSPLPAPFDPSIYLLTPRADGDALDSVFQGLSVTTPLDAEICPAYDADDNFIPEPDRATIYAIEILSWPSHDATLRRLDDVRSSELRYQVLVNNEDLGEFTTHILRPAAAHYRDQLSPPASTPLDVELRRPALGVAADRREGSTFVNSGEYVKSLHLFATQGQGIPLSVDLHYSSLESLFYRGVGRLPNADEYAPSPFGQGWSYTYGIRVLLRDEFGPNQQLELIGPAGERILMAESPSGSGTWRPAHNAGLSWLGSADARVEETANGYRLWSPESRDEYHFDAEGRLASIQRLGYSEKLTIEYRAGTQKVIDTGGNQVVFRFDEKDRITEMQDSAGGKWVFSYTHDSLTSVVHEPTMRRWQFSYNPTSFLLTDIVDPGCRQTELRYMDGTEGDMATFGSFAGSSEAGANIVSVAYPTTDTALVTDANGHTTTYTAATTDGTNTLGKLSITDPMGQVRRFEQIDLDSHHYEGPEGESQTWHYTDGKLTTSSNGLQEVRLRYEPSPNAPNGNRRRLKSTERTPSGYGDSGNAKTSYLYDEFDRPVAIVAADDDPNNPQHPTRIEYDDVGRVAATIDPEGRRTTYTYHGEAGKRNLIHTITSVNPNGDNVIERIEDYDSFGNVKEITDGRGHTWRYQYDSRGLLTRRSAPTGPSIGASIAQYAYDPVGRLVAVQNSRNFSTTFEYDDQKRTVQAAYPDNSTQSWTYDERYLLHKVTNPLGGVTTYTFDELGRVAKVTGPNGQEMELGHDSSDNLTQWQSGPAIYNFTYDAAGQMTEVVKPAMTLDGGTFRPSERYAYDGVGPVITTTVTSKPGTELGWRAHYDSLGQGVGLQSYLGRPDPSSTPSFQTSTTYDDSGLPTGWTGPDLAWPGTGRPADIVDSGQSDPYSIGIGYDNLGRAVSLNEGTEPPFLDWDLDPANNISRVQSVDSSGALATRATAIYDKRGQIATLTNERGERTHFAYDGNGNLVWRRDHRNCTTEYAYDSMDRLIRSVQQIPTRKDDPARALVMDYGYDKAGNMVSVTGPYETIGANRLEGSFPAASTSVPARGSQDGPVHGPRESGSFDFSGRPVTYTVAGAVYTVIYRDGQNGLPKDGRPYRLVAPDGQFLEFEYEGGRIVGLRDATRPAVRWTYNGQEWIQRAQRGEYKQLWVYEDNLPYPSRMEWKHGNKTFWAQTKADDKGRWPAEITLQDETTVTYTYGKDGRVSSIGLATSPNGQPLVWSFEYDSRGQLRQLDYPNGLSTKVTAHEDYDERIGNWTVTDRTGAEIAAWAYNYYPNGVVSVNQKGRSVRTQVAMYYWNDQGLKWENVIPQRRGEDPYAAQYTYLNGNIGTKDEYLLGKRTSRLYRFHGNTHLLTRVDEEGDLQDDPVQYQYYDAQGNVQYSGTEDFYPGAPTRDLKGKHFEYDELGRLARVIDTTRGTEVAYAYLATGELAKRTEKPSISGGTTYWVDYGIGIRQQLDEEHKVIATYLDDPDGYPLLRLLGSAGSNPRYYVSDPEGNIVAVAQHEGFWHSTHSQPQLNAFGKPIEYSAFVDAFVDDYGYAGAYRDPETGFIHVGNGVWYDPDLGRFLQPAGGPGRASPYQSPSLAPAPEHNPFQVINQMFPSPHLDVDQFLFSERLPSIGGPSIKSVGGEEFLSMLPVIGAPVRAHRRYKVLHARGGLSQSDATFTALALASGELIGADGLSEAYANINTLDRGQPFEPRERVFVAGMNGIPIGGMATWGAGRGIFRLVRPQRVRNFASAVRLWRAHRAGYSPPSGVRVIAAAETNVGRAANKLRSMRCVEPMDTQQAVLALRGARRAAGLDSLYKRNVAIADYNFGGVAGRLYARSGQYSPPGTVPIPAETQRMFAPLRREGVHNADHGFDSEVKLYEALARIHRDAARHGRVPGKVIVYTERNPCGSCYQVGEQFQALLGEAVDVELRGYRWHFSSCADAH